MRMTILIIDSNNTHVETTTTIQAQQFPPLLLQLSSTEVPMITTNGSILETETAPENIC
jgi:hypothetical protein